MIQTPRRNVLRKLVQSMMLPHKPEEVVESNRDRKCDAGEKEEGEAGDGGKSPRKSTPKKNATKNGIVATADDHINVSPSLPNLRLEAKLRAEIRGCLLGSNYIPFSRLRKEKNQEAIIADNGGCQDQGKDKIVTIGPI
ncbi:LOW QUALITY PROTEIN: hypothetical protein HID58_006131, partial [Brassica napus]